MDKSPAVTSCSLSSYAHGVRVVLHQNEAFGVVIIGTELNVAPLDGDEFSAAQPGAHCHQQ